MLPSPTRCRFITVGVQRSGTTATHLALRGHPQVATVSDEVKIDPFFTAGVDVFTVGQGSENTRRATFAHLFDAVTMGESLTADPSASAIRANGMKIAFRFGADAQQFADCVTACFPDLRIIHVVRRDLVAILASRTRAIKTGKWHSWTKALGSRAARFAIDPGEFKTFAKGALEADAIIAKLAKTHPILAFSYEDDIVAGAPASYRKLFDFVGVANVEPTWLISEKVAPPVEEFVENLDELRAIEAKLTRGRR